jgi:hypothetical protein
MSKTLYDIMDSWTMTWDRESIELTLKYVSAPFYKHKLIFFLLEELWDLLECIDDPLEFMTDERKIKQLENLLSHEEIELAAKSVQIQVVESPEFKIIVQNVDDLISQYPLWFEPYETEK